MPSYGIMEQVCEILFMIVCKINPNLYLSEQGVVLYVCKITEPRKNQLKIEIKHLKRIQKIIFYYKIFCNTILV